MNRVVLFKLSSQNPELQAKFFSDVFGWEVSEPQWGYSTAKTGSDQQPGIDGGIAQGPAEFQQGTRIQIQVASIDESIEKRLKTEQMSHKRKWILGTSTLHILSIQQEYT